MTNNIWNTNRSKCCGHFTSVVTITLLMINISLMKICLYLVKIFHMFGIYEWSEVNLYSPWHYTLKIKLKNANERALNKQANYDDRIQYDEFNIVKHKIADLNKTSFQVNKTEQNIKQLYFLSN